MKGGYELMENKDIYKDIARRTGGDIYIGVVGPVRTGKSTFIHRLIDEVVLPNIENEFDRERTLDEIPQSAGGRTVMTTEPKFVPDEAVRIKTENGAELNVKLIDCVGYMVDGALGAEEDGVRRMITTPWSEEPMPFEEAAELGTSKVIREHSTIGILVTTDGSITDIDRAAYLAAEERVAGELTELGKPFCILLNSKHPESDEAKALAVELEAKYGVPVALVNCMELNATDVREILGLVLSEFPISKLCFRIPEWTLALPRDSAVSVGLIDRIRGFAEGCTKLGDVSRALDGSPDLKLTMLDAGDGTGEIELPLGEDVYFRTLSESCGLEIKNGRELFKTVCELSKTRDEYERVRTALCDVDGVGYGIVMPTREGMTLEEPRTVKEGAGYGVKITAHAEAIQMIKTEIRADVCPVVATEERADEVVRALKSEYEESPEKIWDANILGRSLYELVSDGMNEKLGNIPEEARMKLGETLERIINEGANGLICILV